jgi:hypothetical protein
MFSGEDRRYTARLTGSVPVSDTGTAKAKSLKAQLRGADA